MASCKASSDNSDDEFFDQFIMERALQSSNRSQEAKNLKPAQLKEENENKTESLDGNHQAMDQMLQQSIGVQLCSIGIQNSSKFTLPKRITHEFNKNMKMSDYTKIIFNQNLFNQKR
jgi:hypothetical protein